MADAPDAAVTSVPLALPDPDRLGAYLVGALNPQGELNPYTSSGPPAGSGKDVREFCVVDLVVTDPETTALLRVRGGHVRIAPLGTWTRADDTPLPCGWPMRPPTEDFDASNSRLGGQMAHIALADLGVGEHEVAIVDPGFSATFTVVPTATPTPDDLVGLSVRGGTNDCVQFSALTFAEDGRVFIQYWEDPPEDGTYTLDGNVLSIFAPTLAASAEQTFEAYLSELFDDEPGLFLRDRSSKEGYGLGSTCYMAPEPGRNGNYYIPPCSAEYFPDESSELDYDGFCG